MERGRPGEHSSDPRPEGQEARREREGREGHSAARGIKEASTGFLSVRLEAGALCLGTREVRRAEGHKEGQWGALVRILYVGLTTGTWVRQLVRLIVVLYRYQDNQPRGERPKQQEGPNPVSGPKCLVTFATVLSSLQSRLANNSCVAQTNTGTMLQSNVTESRPAGKQMVCFQQACEWIATTQLTDPSIIGGITKP